MKFPAESLFTFLKGSCSCWEECWTLVFNKTSKVVFWMSCCCLLVARRKNVLISLCFSLWWHLSWRCWLLGGGGPQLQVKQSPAINMGDVMPLIQRRGVTFYSTSVFSLPTQQILGVRTHGSNLMSLFTSQSQNWLSTRRTLFSSRVKSAWTYLNLYVS